MNGKTEWATRRRDRKGFQALHQRGCVERTFAWIGSGHRYSNDYEQIPSISEIMRPKDEQEIPSAIEIALSAAIDGVPSDVG